MTTTTAPVYVTRGRKYHTDEKCPLMAHGEELWDSDDEDWSHTAGSYRRTVNSAAYAAACGKLPCLGCVPPEQRVFPPLYGQTFGHEPVDEHDRPDVTHLVCARCVRWTSWPDVGLRIGARVAWPCTSAVVLGLAPGAAA